MPNEQPDTKLKKLVCDCIREQCLSEVLTTVFRDRAMWHKYYDMSDTKLMPLITEETSWNRLMITTARVCQMLLSNV